VLEAEQFSKSGVEHSAMLKPASPLATGGASLGLRPMASARRGIGREQQLPDIGRSAKRDESVGACPEHRGLVHGDLLAGNVLVAGEWITAVLDWGNSIAGDPLYDLAWLIFWSPWHPGLDPARLRSVADDLYGGSDIDERLRCYHLHIGLDGQQYSGFTRNWRQLAETAARTAELGLA
jgi:hygromycin-B 4-O-kinase